MTSATSLPTIELKNIFHREQHVIALFFKYNRTLIDLVKTIPQAAFSKTNRCWYVFNMPGVLL
ncbi:MAG: hypothetical protein JST43_13495 [Bacteroidetes bacterium]|nr:hypothetical protein [Bacteroidota bacterium]MBS1541848.1 hypothetical protein [Bacteroidota bacterium]